MTFKKFLSSRDKSLASVISTEELLRELERRDIGNNIFPLDVFHPKIKPLLSELHTKFDIPRPYLGLALLMVYSTAIGTAYVVSRNEHDRMYLSLWGALNGISSSGKSHSLDNILDPINKIQTEFDKERAKNAIDETEQLRVNTPIRVISYRDAYIPTLVRYVIPCNPKGIIKEVDEILEWINGFNSLSGNKDSIDEQFWLSGWNGKKYSAIRTNNVKINIPRVFINVMGGIQPELLYKLFKNDRGVSGFVFRILFATPEEHRLSDPIEGYTIPSEYRQLHEKHIFRLYFDLPVEDGYEEPKICKPTPEATALFQQWSKQRILEINHMDDEKEKNLHAGILGKIKEYIYRFAAILRVADIAYDFDETNEISRFPEKTSIAPEVMERAIKLGNYFYQSAVDVYRRVDNTVSAPFEVLQMATLLKNGKSLSQMAIIIHKDESKRSKVNRDLKEAIKNYPKVFGAIEKNK